MPPILSQLAAHRIFFYSFFSSLAVAVTIANALKNYSNFYSIVIFLSKSSRSVLVLANFACLVALLGGHIVQKIFFGSLRPNEVERLYDRLWFFVTESLLAFTIFRDEFDFAFVVMFGFLLFVKSFHWLAGDRIEWMDQRPYPGPPLLFHLRMVTLFCILWFTDVLLFVIAVESTIANGVGGMVLFASEYAILMATIGNTIAKYMLSSYDLRRAGQRGGENAPPWENKSMFVFYIELATDFLKLTTYLVFFTIILTFYGLPLNIIRDVWMTARSFISRLRALHRYQNATRNMDQRYPNATEDELHAMTDRTCIICREEMIMQALPQPHEGPNTTPKKLPCGHIFHFHCLRSWLERQQSCPTCRRTVLDNTPGQPDAGAPAPPPQPQPGVNPANPPPFGQQNPQGLNNPLGNPLGLVGRFFGPPPQEQVGAGAPQPPAQPPVNFNVPQNAIAVAQPTGVVIQYHIQYQNTRLPAQTLQIPNTPAPQPLQPVPQFPGFVGPGGLWQQWPAQDARNAPPQASPPEPSPPPTERTETPDPATSTSARDAAAQAALRRFSAERPRLPSTSARPADQTQSSSSSSLPTTLPTPRDNAQRIEVPKLIPLYDLATVPPTLGSPSATVVPPSPWRAMPRTPVPQSPTPGGFNFRTNQEARFLQQQPVPRLPINQLPPTLTDEQLGVMDRVTREAIDERLRVLEGVSGAVYRCMDDLLRMRSVLPTPSTTSNNTTVPPSEEVRPGGSESVGFGKNDPKEPATSKSEEKKDGGTDEPPPV